MEDQASYDTEEARELQATIDARRAELHIVDEDEREQVAAITDRWLERIAQIRQRPAPDPDPAELERLAEETRRAAAQRRADWQATRAADWTRTVPPRFRDAHRRQLVGELADLEQRWNRQQNVLILGAVGVGKTHAAVAMARMVHDAGASVQFAPSVQLLDELRPGGDEHALDRARTVDVLILDDLGAERPTDWTAERLYLLVNDRWLNQRPIIATSNLDAAALESAVGARMFSRLYHEAARLEVAGSDRRRTADSAATTPRSDG